MNTFWGHLFPKHTLGSVRVRWTHKIRISKLVHKENPACEAVHFKATRKRRDGGSAASRRLGAASRRPGCALVAAPAMHSAPERPPTQDVGGTPTSARETRALPGIVWAVTLFSTPLEDSFAMGHTGLSKQNVFQIFSPRASARFFSAALDRPRRSAALARSPFSSFKVRWINSFSTNSRMGSLC